MEDKEEETRSAAMGLDEEGGGGAKNDGFTRFVMILLLFGPTSVVVSRKGVLGVVDADIGGDGICKVGAATSEAINGGR